MDLRALLPIALLIVGLPVWGEGPDALKVEQQQKLGAVRTVFVDELNGSDSSAQIRDMLIGSLHRAGVFVITEDAENADAFLRGAAEDLVYNEYVGDREGVNMRGATSQSRRESGESRFNSSSFGVSDSESNTRRDHKHEALAAVRLVLRSGEVIWSTTQESAGAKYRGAGADVAEKVTKELIAALEHARKAEASPGQ
jgi:hypothetical protein